MTTDITIRDVPYHYAGEVLELEITAYEFDDRGEEDITDGRQIVLVDEPEWETLVLDFDITISHSTLDHVFQDSDDHEGALFAATYCPNTHKRDAEAVATGTIEPDTHRGSLKIKRSEYRDDVQITPKLIQNQPTSHGSTTWSNYATEAGRVLATGPTYTIYLDEPALSIGGDLPVDAAPFSERDDLGNEANEWYVDTRDPSKPKLWINKDHPYVVNAVREVDSQTIQGRVGNAVLEHIAVSMLTQFCLLAAREAVRSGAIEYEWQENLLTEVCGDFFGFGDEPDVDVLESALLNEAIVETVNGIEQVIQRRRTPQNDVKKLLQVIGND